MTLRTLAVLLPALLLVGCEARQMNLVAPDLGMLAQRRGKIDEEDIRKAFDDRPNISPGSTVGVMFIPQTDPSGLAVRTLPPTESTAWKTSLVDGHYIVNVMDLSPTSAGAYGSNDLLVLRNYAANLHCDLMVVYSVACDYSRTPNPFALLYLTLIGAFFVPGDSITVGSIAKVAMVDVRRGYVYGIVEGSATQSMAIPMMLVPANLGQAYQSTAALALKDARAKLTPLLNRLRDEAVEVVR